MLMIGLIVVQGLTFLALVFFLKKVLYSNFSKAMKRLELINQETEKKRSELAAKLLETEKNFDEKLKEQEKLASKIREEAETEAEETKSRVLAQAKEQADKLLEQSRNQQDEIRKELEGQMGEKAAHLAGDALRYLMTMRLDQAVHHHLILDLIDEIEKVDGKRLNGQSTQAFVTVPYALEAAEKSKLEQALEKKVKRKVSVKTEEDRALIAGMILKFENVILDGSLKAKLKEAVSYVRKGEKKDET